MADRRVETGPPLRNVLRLGLLRPPHAPQRAGQRADGAAPKRELQAFQIGQLRLDYADFQAQPRFYGLSEFFFSALYAPADFGLRNEFFSPAARLADRFDRPRPGAGAGPVHRAV
ncbi:MAG: hypothetical protein V9H69_04520 [Anaerolineae bacterium]